MADMITVGVDGSEPSLLAVRWAVREAALLGAGLCVCCVAVEDTLGHPMLWTSPQLVRRDATDVARQAAAKAADDRADVPVSVRVGSVSERLARHPPRPLVVVRGDTPAWDGPVLVGVDDAPETARAVEFAATAADTPRGAAGGAHRRPAGVAGATSGLPARVGADRGRGHDDAAAVAGRQAGTRAGSAPVGQGSVGSHVIRHSACPVAVVPGRSDS